MRRRRDVRKRRIAETELKPEQVPWRRRTTTGQASACDMRGQVLHPLWKPRRGIAGGKYEPSVTAVDARTDASGVLDGVSTFRRHRRLLIT